MTDSKQNSIADFRNRWTATLSAATNNDLLKGLPGGSPFGVTMDGYVDLRGFPIRAFVKEAKLNRIDFTACRTEQGGQFDWTTINECLFLNADLPTNLGSRFNACQFALAKLRGTVFRGRFEKSTFAGADLSSAMGNTVTFENCDFSNANIRKAHFFHCRFIGCSFSGAKFRSGSFADSEFRSCGVTLAQIGEGNTVIEGVRIEG